MTPVKVSNFLTSLENDVGPLCEYQNQIIIAKAVFDI